VPIAGDIQLGGVVYDTAFRNVGGATVEVLDGPHTGASTTTDSQGRFSFSGVFDDGTRFRASKAGHLSSTRTPAPFCDRCNPHRWVYFNLEEPAGPVNIAGEYNITFVAGESCTALPDAFRTRTYAATVTLTPPASSPEAQWLFSVTMTGVPFVGGYRSFRMAVAGDYVGFPDNEGATLVEEVAPNTYLSYNAFGWAGGQIVGARAGATMETSFVSTEYCVLSSPFAGAGAYRCPAGAIAHAECGGNNRLILTRR
jgi:hypothetical protein